MRPSNHRLMGQMEKETGLNDPNNLMDTSIEGFWTPNGRGEAAIQNHIAIVGDKGIPRLVTRCDGGSQVLQARAHWMGGKWNHLDWKGETFSQVGHALRLVGNHKKALRNRGDNFLTQQRTTTTFQEGQLWVNLVGPIQVEIEDGMGVQGGQRNPQSSSKDLHGF